MGKLKVNPSKARTNANKLQKAGLNLSGHKSVPQAGSMASVLPAFDRFRADHDAIAKTIDSISKLAGKDVQSIQIMISQFVKTDKDHAVAINKAIAMDPKSSMMAYDKHVKATTKKK